MNDPRTYYKMAVVSFDDLELASFSMRRCIDKVELDYNISETNDCFGWKFGVPEVILKKDAVILTQKMTYGRWKRSAATKSHIIDQNASSDLVEANQGIVGGVPIVNLNQTPDFHSSQPKSGAVSEKISEPQPFNLSSITWGNT